jgi:hypothetical protein
MENLSFDQFAEFVRECNSISLKSKIAPESEFEADLGIPGDDGGDLLKATEQRFNISLCSLEHGYRERSMLGRTSSFSIRRVSEPAYPALCVRRRSGRSLSGTGIGLCTTH